MLLQVVNPAKKLYMNNVPCVRNLFQNVLNKVFNAVDEDRREKLGPDRTCAEWLLRNGASVKFKGSSEFLKDYNKLPDEDFPFKIAEVEAIDSSISQYGFGNFKGCQLIWKIVFDRCYLLDNEAMKGLLVLNDSLRHLKITNCPDITDGGLLYLKDLNLEHLEMHISPYVKDKENVFKTLKLGLPKCNIIMG
ncbi:ATP synthase subunit s, mitochondrial-like [Harmonia axyridis]|uniref:ATP synthase subunit s, mitochondrial-like n=1 Tax=Harmonia axyridis TaxID=115357 RepID=UPI001E2793A2|nr:ATP synthase subunit s, mitochondrial-like [Harmonia axyridis]